MHHSLLFVCSLNTDFSAPLCGQFLFHNLLCLTKESFAYNAPVMSRTQLRLGLLLLLPALSLVEGLTEEGAVRA
jgi:hypothetical protein